ncbi:MAG TPA: copper homeostasis protein CutC [Gemmatimonadales bacterium]|jgi:copper homeostasis protein|nr:copper homeostasis protein CutC [Gemmatimonadales bacterium]
MTVLVEACVDSLRSAREAAAGGAGRLELCQNLTEGGTTPSWGLLAEVREKVALPLHALIRPRGGDSLYSGDEIAVMLRDIAAARDLGADGLVLGALDAEGRVDSATLRRLLDVARPAAVTFHRAFDLGRDPAEALDALVALGIERVLTSGQAATAEAGIPRLAELVVRAAGRIEILAGGGIQASNAARIVRETGVREIHVRGSKEMDSAMAFRRTNVQMGKRYEPDEYRRIETEATRVQAIVAAVNG